MGNYFGQLYSKKNDDFFSFLIRCENEYKHVRFYIWNKGIKDVLKQSIETSLSPPELNDDDKFNIEYNLSKLTGTKKFKFNTQWSDILFVVNSQSNSTSNLMIYTKKVVIDFDKTGDIIIAPTDISGSLDNYIEETANSLRVEIRK